MLKNIIFSIWSDLTEDHMSVNDYKKKAFKTYKSKLIKLQKNYAYYCKADYEIFKPKSTDYVNVQFDKILTHFYERLPHDILQVSYYLKTKREKFFGLFC